jgi:hypothetical protein
MSQTDDEDSEITSEDTINRLFVWGSNIYWQLGFEVDAGEDSIAIPH